MDNDGDLDLVVNNIDQEAFLYENQQNQSRFIRFKFSGPTQNPMGLGTKVFLYHGNKFQYQQHYLIRGYRSSMEPIMHFGLDQDSVIQKVEVIWPDGKASVYRNVAVDQVMSLNYEEADTIIEVENQKAVRYFEDVTDKWTGHIRHNENEMNDYLDQPLLPHKLSSMGPAFAVADINSDGLDDFFLGGSFRRAGQLLLQEKDGGFRHMQKELWNEERLFEDVDAVFLDVDNDNDPDLYVVSGGTENTLENGRLKDRVYLNDGHGNFTKTDMDLPNENGAVAVPADIDKDGDLDLFVGGRMIPGNYPLPADSYLLINDGGIYKDATHDIAPDLKKIGMVTDALWTDYDMDGDLDLFIVGEWMPVTILNNEGGVFHKINARDNGLEHSSGWWWSIASDDFDNDGDPDYIVGNMGFNYKFKASKDYPLELFSLDFDDNKSLDFAMGYYQDGQLFPAYSRKKTITQNAFVEEAIPTNNKYANATLYDIYGKENLEEATRLQIQTLATSYIENMGDGTFRLSALDNRAQISNINSIIIKDIDLDGNKDLVVAGNLFSMENETIRNDGGIGLWLRGNGRGNFEPVPLSKSGLYIPGDVRHLKIAKTRDGLLLLSAKNTDQVQSIEIYSPAN